MNEKGIAKPPEADRWIEKFGDQLRLTTEAWRWVSRVFAFFPKVQTFDVAVTPGAVSANSESVQTVTVTGLTTNDRVMVNKPTNQSGLDLVHYWVSAADTLSIKYRNHTGGSITPTSETYRVAAIRL